MNSPIEFTALELVLLVAVAALVYANFTATRATELLEEKNRRLWKAIHGLAAGSWGLRVDGETTVLYAKTLPHGEKKVKVE